MLSVILFTLKFNESAGLFICGMTLFKRPKVIGHPLKAKGSLKSGRHTHPQMLGFFPAEVLPGYTYL